MRLSEIMTTDLVTVGPDLTIAEAHEQMRLRDVHHLIVLDKNHVVGVMSARDRSEGHAGTAVRDVMHRDLVSATTDTTVREAANLLRGRSVGCLPVFDGDQLVGIVTITDLLELIGRGVERPIGESTKWTVGRKPELAPKRG